MRQIRRILSRNRIQTGGRRVKCPVREGIVEVDGYHCRYECVEEDENTLLFRGGGKRPCFLLHIYPSTKQAILLGFERALNCSLNENAPIKSAARAAFKVAQERGVQHFELSDEATRDSSPGKRFVLSDMEFLSSGVAWYESCMPIQPVPQRKDTVERWRQRVRTNSWTSVIECLQRDIPNIHIPISLEGIDTTAEGSAMAVFARIKEAKTDFFSDYRFELPLCSGIGSLFGVVWEAHLN